MWKKENTTMQHREENRAEVVMFQHQVRKRVEEEVAFHIFGWEMRAEKNYNRDA